MLSWAILNLNFIVKLRVNELRNLLQRPHQFFLSSGGKDNQTRSIYTWNHRIVLFSDQLTKILYWSRVADVLSILRDCSIRKLNLTSSSNERVKTFKLSSFRKLKHWTELTVSIRRDFFFPFVGEIQTRILLESFEKNFKNWNGRKYCFRVDGRTQQQQQQL